MYPFGLSAPLSVNTSSHTRFFLSALISHLHASHLRAFHLAFRVCGRSSLRILCEDPQSREPVLPWLVLREFELISVLSKLVTMGVVTNKKFWPTVWLISIVRPHTPNLECTSYVKVDLWQLSRSGSRTLWLFFNTFLCLNSLHLFLNWIHPLL